MDDDLLNGSAAQPLYGEAMPVAQSPSETGTARAGRSSGQAVLVAWLAMAGLLVLANVVTFEVQR